LAALCEAILAATLLAMGAFVRRTRIIGRRCALRTHARRESARFGAYSRWPRSPNVSGYYKPRAVFPRTRRPLRG
jgi:hypothetical protein